MFPEITSSLARTENSCSGRGIETRKGKSKQIVQLLDSLEARLELS
jgi:hypothetical protein